MKRGELKQTTYDDCSSLLEALLGIAFRRDLRLEAVPDILLVVTGIPTLEGTFVLVKDVLVEEDRDRQHDRNADEAALVRVVQHVRPERERHGCRGKLQK